MVTRLDRGHALADLDHDAGALMAQHRREHAFRVLARQGEGVGMANAGIRDPDKHLALARRLDVDLDDFQWLSRPEGNCCT